MTCKCEECKCAEIKMLEKKVERLEQKQKELLLFTYRLVDKLEEKKCQ
jgi:hypothetical protein